MLIEVDYHGKTGSVYQCDRCHRKINTKREKRYVINISKSKIAKSGLEKIKKLDLCRNCIRKWLKEGEIDE